jgi:hypothetical protein
MHFQRPSSSETVKVIHPNDLAEIQAVKVLEESVPSSREFEANFELPDTQMRNWKINILGKAWVLHGKITTDLLNRDTLMDFDGDDDVKVQNTKSQLDGVVDAALCVKFEL